MSGEISPIQPHQDQQLPIANRCDTLNELFTAIEKGSRQDVKRLLSLRDIQVNGAHPGISISPLVMAVSTGNAEIVRLILNDARVNPNLSCNIPLTINPLILAIISKRVDLVELLLSHRNIDAASPVSNIQINRKCIGDITPMQAALITGQDDIASLFLDREDCYPCQNGGLFLDPKVFDPNQGIVIDGLSRESRVVLLNQLIAILNRPLQQIWRMPTHDILNLLAHLDPNFWEAHQDDQKFLGRSDRYLIDCVLSRPACEIRGSVLHMAAFFGDIDAFKYIFKTGKFSINEKTSDTESTPLHLVLKQTQDKEKCRELVDYILGIESAESNPKDFCGWTPLYYAIKSKHNDCVEHLLELRDSPHLYDEIVAAVLFNNQFALDKLLKDDRADVNKIRDQGPPFEIDPHSPQAQNRDNKSNLPLLHLAVKFQHLESLKKLLDHATANINERYGRATLLISAIIYGFQEIVDELMNRPDIDLELTTTDGFSPLMIACKMNRIDIVRKFLEKGVDIAKQNPNDGDKTALDYTEIPEIAVLLGRESGEGAA